MEEDNNRPALKIGQMARRLGLSVRTLRFYESIGLLPDRVRTAAGYRLYTDREEQRVRFILQAKRAGFSLDQIRRIMQLGQDGHACEYVRLALVEHISALDAQIAGLERFRSELAAVAVRWWEAGGLAEGQICGLIEGLSSPTSIDGGIEMSTTRRRVEVFTAGCPVCDPVVEMVKRLACDNCDVIVHDLQNDPEAAQKAVAIGVHRVPMVLVDGHTAQCCHTGPVTEEGLRAAGIGSSV